ncbi:MAG TPA: hypothetical protein EYN67_01965 [Flavobacteriales bacterium]|nr:hypothetical protein [Flavobacteriales bacterium]
MEDLESKSIDELIAIIEELNESIEEKDQAIDELQEESADFQDEINQHTEINEEEVAEAAFNAGYDANENGELCMRSWLNYKIEARL